MSEYSELIKKFDKIRNYIREFYIYGFKSRENFNKKSLRSYDNERRRIESYLSDIIFFKSDELAKNIFISVDTREVLENPLYRTFKTKSFTKNDVSLHFILLDILEDRQDLNVNEIYDIIFDEYIILLEEPVEIDVSTVRNKLKEYEKYGFLIAKKQGKQVLYSKSVDDIQIDKLKFAIMYFSETSPLGLIGSYILDKLSEHNKYFTQKHNYLFYALESEILYSITQGIMERKNIEITTLGENSDNSVRTNVVPIKILVSSLGGRRYLTCYDFRSNKLKNYRLDRIKSVKLLDENNDIEQLKSQVDKILHNTWGVSYKSHEKLERVEILFHISTREKYIKDRILREGRKGVLTHLEDYTYKYEIEVYDPIEMLPWIRSFTGKIISLTSTNKLVEDLFYRDLNKLYNYYLKEWDE